MLRATMRRVDQGRALKQARRAAGLSLQALAARTTHLDPEGKGVSFQLISLLESHRDHARELTTTRTADMLERALGMPEGSLFTPDPDAVPGDMKAAEESWRAL